MTLHEPATFVTDCLLAALAAALAIKLRHHATTPPSLAPCWLGRALGLLALSAVIGGAYHGFAPEIEPAHAKVWWKATLILIHIISAMLGLSLMHAVAAPRLHGRIQIGITAKLVCFVVISTLLPIFLIPVLDYGTTMLAWLIVALALRPRWWLRVVTAVVLSALAALVQQLAWSPLNGFNHNDLYHVIQGLALIAFYKTGRLLTSDASRDVAGRQAP